MVAKAGSDHGVRWKLAPALVKLVAQLDAAVPHRNRVSDGSIASHQHHITNPRSDHEPHQFGGGEFVTAVDVTHDTEKGINCHYLWDSLIISKDPRIKYVIFNRRIFNSPPFVSHTAGAKRRGAWNPGDYDGSSPHTHHLHLSIWGDKATETGDWSLPAHLTSPDRAAHLERTAKATKRLYATDSVGHMSLKELDAAIRKEAANPQLVEQAVLEMLGDDATSNSLRYMLRWYRQVAKRAGLSGANPEAVADWLADALRDLTDGKADA